MKSEREKEKTPDSLCFLRLFILKPSLPPPLPPALASSCWHISISYNSQDSTWEPLLSVLKNFSLFHDHKISELRMVPIQSLNCLPVRLLKFNQNHSVTRGNLPPQQAFPKYSPIIFICFYTPAGASLVIRRKSEKPQRPCQGPSPRRDAAYPAATSVHHPSPVKPTVGALLDIACMGSQAWPLNFQECYMLVVKQSFYFKMKADIVKQRL